MTLKCTTFWKDMERGRGLRVRGLWFAKVIVFGEICEWVVWRMGSAELRQ